MLAYLKLAFSLILNFFFQVYFMTLRNNNKFGFCLQCLQTDNSKKNVECKIFTFLLEIKFPAK